MAGRLSVRPSFGRLARRAGTIIWFHICTPCFPGCGWRRLLSSAHRPGLGYCLDACLKWCHWHFALSSDTRSPAHYHERAPFLGSVDCWPCQLFIRSLGAAPPTIRASCCVSWRGLPPLEAYMQRACYRRSRLPGFVVDHALGNSVGAIESVACSDCAVRAFEVGDWGCFGDPVPGTIRPFGGLAGALRRAGER